MLNKFKISNQVKVDSFVLFTFVALFRLPQLLPPSLEFLASAGIALFLLLYTCILATKNNFILKNISTSKVYLVLIYLSLEILSFFRSGINEVMDLGSVIKFIGLATTIVFFVLFSMSNIKNSKELNFFIKTVIYSFSFLIVMNFTLYIFGITQYQSGNEYSFSSDSLLLSVIGMNITSVIFSLEAGPKLLGSILVFIGTISLVMIKNKIKNKENFLFFLILFILCSWMILLSDARLYLAVLIMFLIITPVYRMLSTKVFLQTYLIIFPIIPILLLMIASYIADIPGMEVLSRSADDNISSLSGRTFIWSAIAENIQQFNPELLYGYGAAGTVDSGINNQVTYLFKGGWENTGIKTAHNIILQQLLDKGIIGVGIFLLVFRSFINTFNAYNHSLSDALLFGVLALMVSASLNTLFYYASSESYVLFLILLGLHTSKFFEKDDSRSKY